MSSVHNLHLLRSLACSLAPWLCALACAPQPAGAPAAAASAPGRATLPELAALAPIAPIHAPFPMPALARPEIPNAVFDIREYGAVPGGEVKNTDAFKRAVAAATAAGGGVVWVPPGRWLTGPIHLASNINLHVSEGAELMFSNVFADYLPPVFTRWEGLEVYNYSPLIYAKDAVNVAVTGKGTLNGQGEAWWPWKKTQHKDAERLYDMAIRGVPVEQRVFGVEGGLRPSFIQTVNSKNVLIEGVTINNGPMWTLHPLYSENVIVRDVKVVTDGPNNDGIDPDSCKNMLIENSFFSTGDDCVVIKAGLNEDGWRVGKPSENIVVRGLHGERGHGGVVIGSEMSGGVRNVYVDDCDFKGTDRGLRIKSMRGRGGVVENVTYENVRHQDIRLMVVEITAFYASSTLRPKTATPPSIHDITVRNIAASGSKHGMDITGLSEAPIKNVVVENVKLEGEAGVHCIECQNFRFDHVSVSAADGMPFVFENSRQISLNQSCSTGPAACVRVSGDSSSGITIDGQPLGAQASARDATKKPLLESRNSP